MFQLRRFGHQRSEAALDLQPEGLGRRRGVDDNASNQRTDQRNRLAFARLALAQRRMDVGDFLAIALGGFGEELHHVRGRLLAEGFGQPPALGHQLIYPWARRNRVGMPVLDQCQQASDLPLNIGCSGLVLVARAAVLLSKPLTFTLVSLDG